MTIVEFFNVRDIDHLKAWRHLEETGVWPVGFIPENAKFPPTWNAMINAKMARAYVEDMLSGKSAK